MSKTPLFDPALVSQWQGFKQRFMRAFHRYASWLVSLSWWRFAAYALLLVIMGSIVDELPPFRSKVTETVEHKVPRSTRARPETPPAPKAPEPPSSAQTAPVTPAPPSAPDARRNSARVVIGGKDVITIQGDQAGGEDGVDIRIDSSGVRVLRNPRAAAVPASGAAPASATAAASAAPAADDAVVIRLPKGVDQETIDEALKDAREALKDVMLAKREAAEAAADAAREAERAAREGERIAREALDKAGITIDDDGRIVKRTTRLEQSNLPSSLALLWVLGSILIKATYKGRLQAEVKAAQATETAEAESLKRQVVEARMAAMQAQVEPHFLFNTLASIDHLIETDPARASQMQKNLIALLRASMPTMREASDGGARDLGREIAVIRPYLEILKVRMEDRLATSIAVPDGLLSAEFPPMMIQTLVENAIKHGLEPKPEGGSLAVAAEIVHGRLAVSVADTGLGFGRAATAGTGVGLANIRERLALLYGDRGTLVVAENPGGGTRVTITVPYRSIGSAHAQPGVGAAPGGAPASA